jgi:hypothetical protein
VVDLAGLVLINLIRDPFGMMSLGDPDVRLNPAHFDTPD